MNKEMKKVPDVRFKGFTDDWEQRKLENWGTFYYGKSCPKWSITDNANIPCIRYGELYTKFGTKIDKIYSYTNMSPENLKFSKGKEVLIPRVGEDPMDYNHCTWLSMPNIAIGEMISVFNTENDPLFTATMFNATLQNEFACRVEGGSVTNLYFEKLKNIEVSFPKIDEQKKIGKYFDSLDNRITLHQRKLDQLQTLKKYCLQNMFPAKEGKVPAIRFKGFTDDWKQHKLGELLAFRNGFNGNLQQYGSGIPLISVMDILNNSFIFSDTVQTKANLNETEIKRYIVHYGDVLFQRSSETVEDAGSSNVYLDSQNIAVFGGFVICGRKIGDYDPVFFRYLLDSNKIRHQIVIRAQGVQHINVSQDTLEDVSIDLPSKSEQKMIGVCLRNLDNFITLQQHKLDQLQSLKKFMLQNLFIQRK